LDRPRNAPTRTALGVMSLTFYGVLWLEGGNDLIASTFDINVFWITWGARIGLFVLPPLAFVITRRICFGLQRRDRDKLLHGYESGVIKRLPDGKYYEQHQPISDEERAILLARTSMPKPLPLPSKTDENGIKTPGYWHKSLQARLSRFFFAEQLPMPTLAEIEEANHHEAEITAERNHEIEDATVGAPRE
jgi:ubiquinol-cytochrome c reductase cytochrome b subunit